MKHYVNVLAIRQCAVRVWTLITQSIPYNTIGKPRKQEETFSQSLTPCYAYFPLELYLRYSICRPCSLFLKGTCYLHYQARY